MLTELINFIKYLIEKKKDITIYPIDQVQVLVEERNKEKIKEILNDCERTY